MHKSVVSNAALRRRARRDVDRQLQKLRDYYSAHLVANEEEEVLGSGDDEEASVSVVPHSRYDNGATYWPNFKRDERINRAAKSAEEPSKDWNRYDVRILKTYGDYKSAWNGMKRSFTCHTSELDSDGEEEALQQAKRTPKPIRHRYGDTDESESECRSSPPPPVPSPHRSSPPPVPSPYRSSSPPLVPPPHRSSSPLPPRHWSSSQQASQSSRPVPSPHRPSVHSSRPVPSPHRASSQSSRPVPSPHRPSVHSSRPVSSPHLSLVHSSWTVPSPHHPSAHSSRPVSSPHRPSAHSSRPVSSPHRPSAHSSRPVSSPHCPSAHSSRPVPSPHRPSAHSSRPVPSPHRPSAHSSRPVPTPHQSLLPHSDTPELFRPSIRMGQSGLEPIPCTAAELHLLTLLENMKHQFTKLTTVVYSLANRVMTDEDCSPEMPEEINFPCGSPEEVDNLERWLMEPRNASMKRNMISSLASIGGEDTKQVTWNILAHMFSDNVAKNINWKGANGKKAFNQMATKALLARAVRKSHVATKATDLDINKHVIRWFNLASDRGGGRRERNRVQAAAVEENSD